MKRILTALAALTAALLCLFVQAQRQPAPATADAPAGDSIRVSLITCAPGPDIYALCGHEAIRIRTADTDSVWNFGMFSFNEPNFVYRFVKGETDYRLMGYPFAWFLPEYMERGSTVWEQDLDLTQEEAARLRGILQHEGIPENSYYRYNYLKDNCATRIVNKLDSAAGVRIEYPREQTFPTWRDAMRHYHANYPWYQFGIDLALGSGLDTEMKKRDDMFVPMVMMKKAAGAQFPDGRRLVKSERVLFQGSDSAVLPATPWWLSPMAIGCLLLIAAFMVAVIEISRRRIIRWINALYFAITGLTGCLSAFLVFVSVHEATSPNLLLLWLNPLQLIFPLFIWSRHTLFLPKAMSVVNCVVLAILLIVWPLQPQSANPAFFPMIGTSLVLSAAFAITTLNPRYNDSETTVKTGRKGKSAAKGKKRISKKR